MIGVAVRAPLDGLVRPGETVPLLFVVPVMEWNHGNGKCLATYWSLAWAPVKLVTPAGRGCAAEALR